MKRQPNEMPDSQPLPREWLPAGLPPDADASWDAAVGRIMSVGSLELRLLATRDGRRSVRSISVIGGWWKAAAGMAFAAAALLAIVLRVWPVPERDTSVPLALIAGDGDPAALWGGFGIEADPVLALIAADGRVPVEGTPGTSADRKR